MGPGKQCRGLGQLQWMVRRPPQPIAQSTLRGGPTTFIPWAANAFFTSPGVGSFLSLAASRRKVSNVPAGLTVVSNVPGSSLM